MRILVKLLMVGALLMFATGAWGGEMADPNVPGFAEGTGISFQLTGADVSPVTITASEPVRILATRASDELTIYMEAAAGQSSTAVTLAGLQPATTYYTYVDHLYLQQPITTDETGSFTTNLDLTKAVTFIVKTKPSTIFLSADAWVDGAGISHAAGWSHSSGTDLNNSLGTWDPATKTATLLADVDEVIEIISHNITLDGNGHSMRGQLATYSYIGGIYTNGIYYLTIKNLSFVNTTTNFRNTSFGHFDNLRFEGNDRGLLIFGAYNLIENCTFTGNYQGLFFYPFSYYNIVKNSEFTGNNQGIYFMGLTMSNEIVDNRFMNGGAGIATYNSDYNIIRGNLIENNEVGISLGGSYSTLPSSANSERNKVYNNNFINNTTQFYLPFVDTGNEFNLPAPDGGNYFSDWTAPDDNFDGIVDVPYLIYGYTPQRVYALTGQDNRPYARKNGWIANSAPVFTAVEAQNVLAYNTMVIPISATDPEGNNIVSLSAGNLPAGAVFDQVTRTFQWQPNGSQTGVYVVSFFAVDDGIPSQTGRLDIVITVGAAQSPTDVTTSMVAEIASQDLPTEVEASYTANIGKVNELLDRGNVTAVINQYQVLLQKIDQDLKAGKITQEDADLLIMMANDGINLLTPAN